MSKKQNFLWEVLNFQLEDKISKPFMHDWKFCFCDILKPQNQKKSIYWVNELSNLTLPLDFSIDWNFPTGMSLSWLSCSFIRSFSNASLPCRQFDRWDLDPITQAKTENSHRKKSCLPSGDIHKEQFPKNHLIFLNMKPLSEVAPGLLVIHIQIQAIWADSAKL